MAKGNKRQRSSNPLVRGIQDFLTDWAPRNDNDEMARDGSNVASDPTDGRQLTEPLPESDLPKRYTIYEPMLLLGPTFVTHSHAWQTLYSSLSKMQRQDLLKSIVASFTSSGSAVTHVAMNAPISATITATTTSSLSSNTTQVATENVTRAPTNLVPLYGEFGPDTLSDTTKSTPTRADFDAAFWVTTSQHPGITQVWAPRWTMFSRGNIREKGRVLGLNSESFPGLGSGDELGQELGDVDVVDMFVGIGYFAFSYLRRGVRRVYGWDLNGWSIEGCRRGCERNGWGCAVFEVGGGGGGEWEGDDVEKVCERVMTRLRCEEDGEKVRCVLFRGDCRSAASVMGRLVELLEGGGGGVNVRHVNLGLLPSGRVAYGGAVAVLSKDRGGWVHVHENAEIVRVHEKVDEVLAPLRSLVAASTPRPWIVTCEHVEMVKTYAPGVGHYVFDVHIQPTLPPYLHVPALLNFAGMFFSTIFCLCSVKILCSSSSIKSCIRKCSMSSGCVRSSSFVSGP